MLNNKVFKVCDEIGVDIGITTFTVYPDDILHTNDEYITHIEYRIKHPVKNVIESAVFKLNKDKLRVFSSIRIGNSHTWTPLGRVIGKELQDITIQYNRDKLLNELLHDKL